MQSTSLEVGPIDYSGPPLNGGLIFLTRQDARRARIKNIDKIEEYVRVAGGHVVDSACLSLAQKLHAFSRPSIFIGESSGCSNFAYFANSRSRLISLVDPSSVHSDRLLSGGWVYNVGYADRTEFVIGSNSSLLHGSPLGAAEYDIDAIRHIVETFRLRDLPLTL
jgi:hypothetical protein